MRPTIQGFGRPIHGFGLPDEQGAVPGSTERRVVDVEGVRSQQYVCLGIYVSGYYRAYPLTFFRLN